MTCTWPPRVLHPFDLVWLVVYVWVLYADCYESQSASCKASYMPRLTARHHDTLDSSTATRQLDRPRQLLDAPAHGVSLDSLDRNSTGTRQARQGSTGKASTAPRQRPRQRLDGASTARQLDSQGSNHSTCKGQSHRLRSAGCGPHSARWPVGRFGSRVSRCADYARQAASPSAAPPRPCGHVAIRPSAYARLWSLVRDTDTTPPDTRRVRPCRHARTYGYHVSRLRVVRTAVVCRGSTRASPRPGADNRYNRSPFGF